MQRIDEDLTYDYLHSSEENFWSILYLTGYLTRDKEEKESADGKITLKIPNKEILFIMHFLQEYLLGLDIVLNRMKNIGGQGRSDTAIFNEYEGKVAVFEAKYSKEVKKLEEDCEKAIQQINHRMYAKEFEDSYDEVICYGISFYKKRCVVKRDVK